MKKNISQIKRALSSLIAPSLIAATTLWPAESSKAAVSLSLFENNTTPNSVSVAPGGTFSVTLNLTSTAEQLTGVDYYFSINGEAAGKVRLAGRDITGSPFNDLLKLNTGDNSSNPGILDSNFSLLSPTNSLDLGAAIANVSSALPANGGSNPVSYLLGKYTFTLDPRTPAGTYTLSTFAYPGSGVVTQAPFFNEQSFNQQAAFSVIVTPVVGAPEPSGLAAILGIGGLLMRRRRD